MTIALIRMIERKERSGPPQEGPGANTNMNETRKTSSMGLIGGILFAVMAVFRLLDLIQTIQYHNPARIILATLLLLAGEALIAVALFLQRRDVLLCAGFGVCALAALLQLFYYSSKLSALLLLLGLVGAALAALALLTDLVPTLRDTARKFWFVPAICAAVNIVFTFFTSILYLFDYGFSIAVSVLFNGILTYGLLAAGLFCALSWAMNPEGIPAAPKVSLSKGQPAGGAYGGCNNAAYQNPGHPNAAPAGASGELEPETYCKLSTHVLLLIFPFGIWYFIWIYRTTRRLNCVADEPPRDPVKKLLLCMFVPFYGIYWIYKSAQRIDKLSAAKGIPSDLSTLCLILAIFVGIIPPILMQDKLNAIVTAGAPAGGMPFTPPQQPQPGPAAAPYQPVQTPPRPQAAPVVQDAADEIRKYKELLDMGAITPEEFEAKKKQLLGL